MQMRLMSDQPFTPSILILTHHQQTAFENIVGKREIARDEQFLLFPTMFSTQSDNCIPICPYFDIISVFAVELEEPEIGISGEGLKLSNVSKLSLSLP